MSRVVRVNRPRLLARATASSYDRRPSCACLLTFLTELRDRLEVLGLEVSSAESTDLIMLCEAVFCLLECTVLELKRDDSGISS